MDYYNDKCAFIGTSFIEIIDVSPAEGGLKLVITCHFSQSPDRTEEVVLELDTGLSAERLTLYTRIVDW